MLKRIQYFFQDYMLAVNELIADIMIDIFHFTEEEIGVVE